MTDQTHPHSPPPGTPTRIPMRREGDVVPRFLIRLMFLLALTSLALVTFAVLTDRPHVGVPANGPITAERMIVLEGERNGSVTIRDDAGGALAALSEREAGFISVIWRGLDRKRQVIGVDPAAPIRLVKFEDGRTAIIDPATGWRADLDAFGQANKARFDALFAL